MTDNRLHTHEMPAYLDKEVSKENKDRFGHAHLAAALRGLIEDDKHCPPYSIGLLGKWGTGKSTVKSLYLDHLQHDERKNSNGVKRRERIYPITFNAWKYGGETDIRKSLFRHIFLELGGKHEEADRHLFRTVSSTTFDRKPLKHVWADFVDQYVLGLCVVGMFAILFVILLALMAWWFEFEDPITKAISIATSAGVVGVLAHKYFTNLPMLSARNPVHITSSPSQTIEEFEDLFLAQIQNFKKAKGKHVRRIVVFIDDLDRLTADEMVSGLDGIRSLIEMASNDMPYELGIVFVISCDEERVADALSKRRTSADLPAAVSSIQDARRYLDRIFQFRLEILPFPKRDMRNFAINLLGTEYPSLLNDLKAREVDLQELVDRMIHPGVQSPRNAIQIVNLFAQCWWLGVLRERAVGVDVPGGLKEHAVTGSPLTLAIICVIRTDFPDFYNALQKNPRLFDSFIDKFVRLKPLEKLPAPVREQLAEFALEKSFDDDSEPDRRWDVKREHRGLRQFMSHVQDVRRPYSLQPLLALSQDPVSRRLGDKAVPIEEALRTADVVALLDAVGLTGSSGTFPADFGALLAELIDELRTESPTIQDNVAYTVAQVDERIPEKNKRRVLGLPIRRAADSERLCWRLGPAKLASIVPYADDEELRALGRSLINDVTTDPTSIRLPSFEMPSMREGSDLIRAAADLVIEIMQKTDLPPQAKTEFGNWLLSRKIRIANQSNQVPLAWLEDKLAAHETILLPLIREQYPQVIAEDLGRDQPELKELSAVTTRLDSVFTHLFEQGTQTRIILWGYLKDFVGLRQSPLVALAFSKFHSWHDVADEEAACSIFAAMGGRLIDHWENPEAWPLDDEPNSRESFTDLAAAINFFDADCTAHMAELARQWSKTTEQASSASQLYAALEKADKELWATLGQEWAKRLFTDLPEDCQKAILVTANTQSSSKELRTALASTIKSLRGAKVLDDHARAALSRLLLTLDRQILEGSPFAEQLTQLIDDTVNLISDNPDDYIVSKALALRGSLDQLSPDNAQNLLNSFELLQPHPQILAGVYSALTDVWPLPVAEGGLEYSAQKLFDSGIAVCSNLGHTDKAGDLLQSLDNLNRRARLTQEDNENRLVACAYDLWSYDPDVSEDIFRRYPQAIRTAEQLVKLTVAATSDEQGDIEMWDESLATLIHEVGVADAETISKATRDLLDQPAQETENLLDPVMSLWTKAVAENDPQLAIDTLLSEDTNDEQAVRLYYRIQENISYISEELFLTLVKKTLSTQEGRDKTADAIVRSLNEIAKQQFTTNDQHRALCEAVLDVFADIPKRDRKADLARFCDEIGLKNVVIDGGYKKKLSADDFDIIIKFTGKIS